MKNEETKKYACPRDMTSGHGCLGMECAAWRWAEPKWGPVEDRRGYCGLAGKPDYPLNPEHEKN
ncbi:MAG: hypothetical protein LBM64_10005 [Deltaproteobacteria bacterium]|jgi:hypothetical protein|nr:hypothetical protein [Deltaproteobacteria bacterium]